MTVDLAPFDPSRAPDSDLVDYHELSVAAFAVDRPDAPPVAYEALIGRLMSSVEGAAPTRYWAAREDGRLVGVAIVNLPDGENDHLTDVEIRIRPDHRRRGLGSRLLRAVLGELPGPRRERVGWRGVTAGTDGEFWAQALGFDVVYSLVLQRLTVADVDPASWAVPVPAGYRLRGWRGSTPEDLLASYANARNSINDAPHGAATYRFSQWTPELIRGDEEDKRRSGIERWTVAAVDEASGEVVGSTELDFLPGVADQGFQAFTAVVGGHRGHGLGKSLKAALMREVSAERPRIASIVTNTGLDNAHMIRVNHEIGYADVRTMLCVEAPLSRVEQRLAAVPASGA